MKEKIVLIDADSMLEGAFYGLPENAAQGMRLLIERAMAGEGMDYLAAALKEEPEKDSTEPKELVRQRQLLREVLSSMRIPILSLKGQDSADVLASAAQICRGKELEVTILTENRCLLQEAGQGITVRIPALTDSGLDYQSWTETEIRERYGLEPAGIKGILALAGERTRRLPGVLGIGEETAASLMRRYETVENLYEHLEEVTPRWLKEELEAGREAAFLGNEKAALKKESDMVLDFESMSLSSLGGTGDFEPVGEDFWEEEDNTSLEAGFHTITSIEEAQAVLSRCSKESSVGLELIVEDGAASALGLSLEADSYCLLPEGELTQEALAGMAGEICRKAGRTTVLHLKNQLALLKLAPDTPVFDAGVAAYLLNPLKDSYEYGELAEDYLGLRVPSRMDLIGKVSIRKALAENRERATACVCYLAYTLKECRDRLEEELKRTGMDRLFYEIETPLIYSLFRMEEAGIKVERDRLKEYGDRLKVRIAEVEQKIYDEIGEKFNINSPKQLGEVLFDHMKLPGGKKTKTGYSTAADVLEKLAGDYPVVSLILDYRQLTKLNSTYADGLAAYISKDGWIHGTFNQTITATGRISSTEPNLQNIPVRMELGREIRRVFVPQEGCVFVDADYSQIELRVLAHMSGDERLINAYRQAEDIHAITASEVFHIPLDQVTPLQRRNAKAVNFGIVYGISSFGLSEGLSITRSEAAQYISKYFETYPGVKAFLDGLVAQAKEQGYAVSMFGRRRPVPELKSSNFMKRSFGERAAMNSPIQGTAADIIKIAMNRVDRAMTKRGLKSRIVLQVHDELLIEALKDELSEVEELLTEEMRHAADLKVALEVEAHAGESWFDAK